MIPDVPLSKSLSGWCMDGQHTPGPNTDGCPGYWEEREWPDPAAPKNRPATYTIPARRCPCFCHKRDLELPTSRRRK